MTRGHIGEIEHPSLKGWVKNLKKNLQNYRQAKGMTQSDLADATRINVSTIAAIEQGRSPNPRLATIAILGSALGIKDPLVLLQKPLKEPN